MSVPQFILWLIFAAFAAEASELIVGISAMYSGWFPGFATALIFLIVGMLLGFPKLALGLLVGFTAATGPCFSDMAYDLKCGYILRGSGANPELEKEGRKQQFLAELMGFAVAFVMVAFFANKYFGQGLFVAVSNTFVATIDAGASGEIAKWLLIWAIPGAIIQLLGGKRQLGILFATGLLVGNIINGLTIGSRSDYPSDCCPCQQRERADPQHPGCRRTGRSCYLQLLHRYSGTGRKERLIGVT